MKLKDIALLTLIVVLTALLVFVGNRTNGIVVFNNLSLLTNHQIIYQWITLLITLILLLIYRELKGKNFKLFLEKGIFLPK